jgi:hypothetical protein
MVLLTPFSVLDDCLSPACAALRLPVLGVARSEEEGVAWGSGWGKEVRLAGVRLAEMAELAELGMKLQG